MDRWTKLCLPDSADKSLVWQLLEMPKVYKAESESQADGQAFS